MQVSLSWKANTEPDLKGYRLYRDGVLLAELGMVTAYIDVTVPAGTLSVGYSLSAVDTSGNESSQTAVVTKVFLPAPPPVPTTKFSVVERKDQVVVSWPKTAYAKVVAPRTTSRGITSITITGT